MTFHGRQLNSMTFCKFSMTHTKPYGKVVIILRLLPNFIDQYKATWKTPFTIPVHLFFANYLLSDCSASSGFWRWIKASDFNINISQITVFSRFSSVTFVKSSSSTDRRLFFELLEFAHCLPLSTFTKKNQQQRQFVHSDDSFNMLGYLFGLYLRFSIRKEKY